MLAVEESRSETSSGRMYSILMIITFICGHTNGNVVYATEWLHISSKLKVCHVSQPLPK
jgi:hypothetical protein